MATNVSTRKGSFTLRSVLEDPRVRRIAHEGQTWYVGADLLAVLKPEGEGAADAPGASHTSVARWEQLLRRDPCLTRFAERLELDDGTGEVWEMLPLVGVLRAIQSVSSPLSEKLKLWLARAGRQQWEEAENPELGWVRLQKLYEQRGYSNPWVQKRLRGMAARQELVREWSRRGVRESEQYRELTNDLMQAAFGMDVNTYRGFKDLRRTSENLRDHMTDLELTLTMLGETTAVALHRSHDARDFAQLKNDVRDAGEIVRIAREEIERRGGAAVISRGVSPSTAEAA